MESRGSIVILMAWIHCTWKLSFSSYTLKYSSFLNLKHIKNVCTPTACIPFPVFFFYPFSLSLALYHCVTCMDITHFGFFKNHKLWAKYYPNLSFRAFRQSMDVKWPLAVNFYHFSFKSVSRLDSQVSRQSVSQSGRQVGRLSVSQLDSQVISQSVSWLDSQLVSQSGRQSVS